LFAILLCRASFASLIPHVTIAGNVTDTHGMRRALAIAVITLSSWLATAVPVRAALAPPMRALGTDLRHLAENFPASSAVEVLDLSTGYHVGYNAGESMPAASTIKIPVMVEVFRQLEQDRFDLTRRVTLLEGDKDYGSGELCDEPDGSTYPVEYLLQQMISISDNTAANMLIRLVGRHAINREMRRLGLHHTRLLTSVRTTRWAVRQDLRTSPTDMVRLLSLMARRKLVDEWSSNEMISILEGDQINTLLPEPLPPDVPIAHKTGSFFDTLDDVGIVYEADAPYVIAVMTTHLPSLSVGRTFIRSLSLMTYDEEAQLARWRTLAGIPGFDSDGTLSPDVRYWEYRPDVTAMGSGG
jgi:beta-lactamase class A